MLQEIREKAEKKVQAKKAFYILAVVFSLTSLLLILLSFYLVAARFWLLLPIPAFIMVLAIAYISTFGWPGKEMFSEDWEEAEVEKEMLRLYRQRKEDLPPIDELSDAEVLELRELERIADQRKRNL